MQSKALLGCKVSVSDCLKWCADFPMAYVPASPSQYRRCVLPWRYALDCPILGVGQVSRSRCGVEGLAPVFIAVCFVSLTIRYRIFLGLTLVWPCPLFSDFRRCHAFEVPYVSFVP